MCNAMVEIYSTVWKVMKENQECTSGGDHTLLFLKEFGEFYLILSTIFLLKNFLSVSTNVYEYLVWELLWVETQRTVAKRRQFLDFPIEKAVYLSAFVKWNTKLFLYKMV